MSGLPKLPDRPRKKQAPVPGASSEARDGILDRPEFDLVRSKMTALASNPAVTRLLENPTLVQDAIRMDPKLASLIHANPNMSELLRPERLSQMLQVRISPCILHVATLLLLRQNALVMKVMKDPSSASGAMQLMSATGIGLVSDGDHGRGREGGGASTSPPSSAPLDIGDLSRHRMTLMQLQNYAAQLNRHQAAPTVAAGLPPWRQQQHADALGSSDGAAGPVSGVHPGSGSMVSMFDRMHQLQQARLMGTLAPLAGQDGGTVLGKHTWIPLIHGSGLHRRRPRICRSRKSRRSELGSTV